MDSCSSFQAKKFTSTDFLALVTTILAIRAATVALPRGLDALPIRAREAPVVRLVDAVPQPADVRALVAPVIAIRRAPVAQPRGLDALAARAFETGVG